MITKTEQTLQSSNDNKQHYYYIKQLDNYSHKPQYFDLSYDQLREGAGRPNTVLWLAASWEGKMALSFPLRITCCVSQEKFPQKPHTKSFIDQAFSVKMAGYLICTFLRAYRPRLRHGPVHKHAKKDLANIQPFWPHAWSITHTYRSLRSDQGVRPMVVNALRGSSVASDIWKTSIWLGGLISLKTYNSIVFTNFQHKNIFIRFKILASGLFLKYS